MGHKHGKNKKSKAGAEPMKVLSLSGIIDIARSGMGFVSVEGLERDIVVYPENLNTALKGDKVKLDVMMRKTRDNKRVEGVVTQVLVRKQNEFLGRLEVKPNFAFLVPDNEKIPMDIFVPIDKLNGGKDGDKAMVRVVEWRRSKNPVGEVLRVLTAEDANEVAMQEILSESGFPLHFSDEALEEAARISDIIDLKEIARREDFRDVLTMTIDPLDAKDFDDAISIQTLKGGYYEVGVHIADVSHYLEAGGPLDAEALSRATSVYLPDRVLPMLPEHLSNVLCSLRPDEEKLTFSAIFTINKKGKIKDYRIAKTIIRSDRRFTYEEAQEIIETGKGDYAKEVLILDEIAKSLRAERFQKGAINFSSTEVRFKLDEKGKPLGIVIKESKDAHKLIEELMLLANRYVAGFASEFMIKGKPLPFPYRIHDEPNEEKLSAFAAFAGKFGYKLNFRNPDQIAQSFNELLREVSGKPEQHVLETLGIRTMSKAIYTTENIGHYGLGFDKYCHFTSPIRRYPDVLVHRIIFDLLRKKVEAVKGLEEMCKHCSDQERNAMEAERTATKYKQVEYMQQFVGDVFEGVISGVTSFGVFVETVEHKCEGMLPLTELSDVDRFDFSESEYTLIGRHSGIRFTIGEHLMIRVVRTDLDKRQIDFALAELPEQKHLRRPASNRPSAAKQSTPKKSKRNR